MVTPSIMCSTGHLPNSTLVTAQISANSVASENGGLAGSTTTSSASRGRSTISEWPRGGSLTTSLTIRASSRPGRPTMTKATRQLNSWASQPPATAPNMVPSGMPNE